MIYFDFTLHEIESAYERVKFDRPYRNPIERPHLFDLIDRNRREWFQRLQEKSNEGVVPFSSRLSWMPKDGGMLRPVSVLTFEDEVVYHLLMGRLYASIYKALRKYQGSPDVGYRLVHPKNKDRLFKDVFKEWKSFREQSNAHLDEERFQYVVASDIAGFFENINRPVLISLLKDIAGDCPEIELLRVCWDKWSVKGYLGIPIGNSASHIFAKVYANEIDKGLIKDGYRHLRYVDDFRIFCSSRSDATNAILRLTAHAHRLGLNIQAAKTKILPCQEALAEFNRSTAIINRLYSAIYNGEDNAVNEAGSYHTRDSVTLRPKKSGTSAVELVEMAFLESFTTIPPPQFDKSLFHFILNRLGEFKSLIAVDYCLDRLRDRPEETSSILGYLGRVKIREYHLDRLTAMMLPSDPMNEYQRYQMLKWFRETHHRRQDVLEACRIWARDMNRDPWLRSYAFAYIEEYGDHTDFDLIMDVYPSCHDEISKCDCVTALKNQDPERRDSFYRLVENDSLMVNMAVKYVREQDAEVNNANREGLDHSDKEKNRVRTRLVNRKIIDDSSAAAGTTST